MNTIYLPFSPTKGEAFSLYVTNDREQTFFPDFPRLTDNNSDLIISISKDGGEFSTATNFITGEYVDNFPPNGQDVAAFWKLDLTATEMNANTIIVTFGSLDANYFGFCFSVIIYTSGATGIASFPSGDNSPTYSVSALNTIVKATNKGYELSQISLNDEGYNYFGLLKDSKIWVIIRELTDQTETRYAQKPVSVTDFATAWANKTTQTYGSKAVIK